MKFVLHFLCSLMAHTGALLVVNQMRRTCSDSVDVLYHIEQDVVYEPISPLRFHIVPVLLSIDIQDGQSALPVFCAL